MRIQQSQMIHKLFLDNQKDKKVTEKTNEFASKETKQDEIQFNISASELKEFFSLAKEADTVREDKVEEISSKIENGEYNVNAKDIIQKVMEEKKNGKTYN